MSLSKKIEDHIIVLGIVGVISSTAFLLYNSTNFDYDSYKNSESLVLSRTENRKNNILDLLPLGPLGISYASVSLGILNKIIRERNEEKRLYLGYKIASEEKVNIPYTIDLNM